MQHNSLKTALYELFRNRHRSSDGWISLTEAQDYGRALGFSADNGGRRVRDLYADGLLEKEARQIEKWGKKLWVEYYKYKDVFAPKPHVQGLVKIGNLL